VAKRIFFGISKLAISAALLYWVLRDLDIEAIVQHLSEANQVWLAIAFLMFFIGYLITALRWRMLLRAYGSSARITYLVQSFMVGIFFNNLLPSTIGGDAVRMYDTWRLGNSKSGAASVVLVDRLMGLLALTAYSLVTVFFAGELIQSVTTLPLLVLGATSILTILAWIIFLAPRTSLERIASLSEMIWPGLGRITTKITSALSAFHGRKALLLRAFGLSLLLQLNVIIHFIIVARAMGIDVPPVAMFTIIPLSILLMMLPVTINGIGLRESVFVFFLGAYGVSANEAVAFAWVALGFVIIQGGLGGIVFLMRREARV